ncbi:MAG: hypothetical protein COC01_05195 [Bacteroidetes bacterium]|nr:MAG: hypothetical protein COC01_05195 [Bacteroidota bacterium]
MNNEEDIKDNEGIQLKDIITFIKESFFIIKENYRLIILAVCLFALAGFFHAKLSKPKFYADATFMSNNDQGSGGTGLLKLVGELGVLPASGGNVDVEKLVELLSTKRIVTNALLKKAKIGSSEDYLANHYLWIYDDLLDIWIDKDHPTITSDFKFKTGDIDKLDHDQNGVMRVICQRVKYRLEAEASRNGIISLLFNSHNQLFSKFFVDYLIEDLSDFFISRSIEQQLNTFNNLELRMDSIKERLMTAEESLARIKDESNRIVKARGNLTELRLAREVKMLSVMYVEGAKNIEIAKYTLLNQTPVIQIIDSPVLPLIAKRKSWKVGIVLGAVCGFIFIVVFLYIRTNWDMLHGKVIDFINQ